MFGVSILNWGLKMYELAFRHSALLAERDSHITTVTLLQIIFQNNLVIKNAHIQPKPKLEMRTHSFYRTSDFSVLHTHKPALQTLNVNIIT